MRKLLVLAVTLVAGCAFAGQHDSLVLECGTLTTNLQNAIVTNRVPITGKIVSMSAYMPGGTTASGTVAITTASGIGSSLGAVKTLLPLQVVLVGGVVTNFSVAQYLAEDYLVMAGVNSYTNAVAPRVVVIYEK